MPAPRPASRSAKQGGLVMSLGQFLQFVGTDLMGSGTVQVWPGTPVQEALIHPDDGRVYGVRLCDQGVDLCAFMRAFLLPSILRRQLRRSQLS